MVNILATSIEYLKGVGPKKADLMKTELGIFTYRDLLYHYPFRYIDRTKVYDISEIKGTEQLIQIKGKILKKEILGAQRRQRLVALIEDETGIMELVWFRSVQWLNKMVVVGQEYVAFGKPNLFNRKINIPHPELELFTESSLKTQFLQPVYHTTEKLTKQRLDSKGIWTLQKNLQEIIYRKIPENLSKEVRERMGFITHSEALRFIHIPDNPKDIEKARTRLSFEELFFQQLKMLRHRQLVKTAFAGKVLHNLDLVNTFYDDHLPFDLTGAQKRVVKEIYHDMCSGEQMNRLLQGDVGSGKTIVAFVCMLIAAGNGSQASIMAPTEILAEQHYTGLKPFCDAMGLRIAMLSGSTKEKDRKPILAMLKSGELDFIVGTHALLEDRVQFKELALSVIDEQHRFGVEQRSRMWNKNQEVYPHVLVMTATPIPRTLAMTLYGDLDVSVIDELPAGRKPVLTVHRFENKRLAVFGFLKKELEAGRQVYIVYPLIEESEKMDLKNLDEGFQSIKRAFPEYKNQISIVHGKMKPADKDFEMDRFVKRETKIMVATTVIEVGINVPNASVMVIENSERFGLSQLHQLRGRVGRGADQSYCILMSDYKLSKDGRTRLETMVRTSDGFEIAEIDLKLRGPGDMLGKKQSGVVELKLVNLSTDGELIKQTRSIAQEILTKDPNLEEEHNKPMVEYFNTWFKGEKNFGKIS